MLTFRRVRRGLALVAAGGVLVAGAVQAAPASATTSALRSDCGVGFSRVDGGVLNYHTVTSTGMESTAEATFNFDGANTQPIAMASTRRSTVNPNVFYYHAATSDGILWRVTVDVSTGANGAKVIKSSGFAGAKQMVLGSYGQLYVLYTTGTLARYRLDGAGQIVGATMISAAPGFKFAKSIQWAPGGSYNGTNVDALVVLTEGNNVNEYLIRQDNGKIARSVTLQSGWSAYNKVVYGGCTNDDGAPLFGITKSFNGYAWFDPNTLDLSGSDIRFAGAYGTGLTGLIFE